MIGAMTERTGVGSEKMGFSKPSESAAADQGAGILS